MDNNTPPQLPNNGGTQNPPAGFLQQLENFLETYTHKKAPFHLPKEIKDFIVNYGPYISLVLALIAIPVVLAVFSFGAMLAPIAIYGRHYGWTMGLYLSSIIALITLIMHVIAFPPLKARQMHGWRLLYNAALIQALGDLLSMNLVGLILGLAVTMFFLFEIKEYYK